MIISTVNSLTFIYLIKIDSIIPSVIFLALCGLSFSFFITSNNNYVMGMSTKFNAGMIAGTHRMVGRFGMLLGIVLFEAILTNSPQTTEIVPFFNTFLFSGILSFVALLNCLFTSNSKTS